METGLAEDAGEGELLPFCMFQENIFDITNGDCEILYSMHFQSSFPVQGVS